LVYNETENTTLENKAMLIPMMYVPWEPYDETFARSSVVFSANSSLEASQFLMSLSVPLNIMRNTALDFGHRPNSQLLSKMITS